MDLDKNNILEEKIGFGAEGGDKRTKCGDFNPILEILEQPNLTLINEIVPKEKEVMKDQLTPMASSKPLNPSAPPFLPASTFKPALPLWHRPSHCYTIPHGVGGYSQKPSGKRGPMYGCRKARGLVPPRLMFTPKDEPTRWIHTSDGKKVWAPKDFRHPDECDNDHEKPLADDDNDDDEEQQCEVDYKTCAESSGLCGRTTIMIRNIPNILKRQELIEFLDEHCRKANKNRSKLRSEYDFVYLPIDYERKANKGYAFVNFTTAEAALRLWKELNGFVWQGFRWKSMCYQSKKTCNICAATIQGKNMLEGCFRNRVFPSEDYQPVAAATIPRDGMNEALLHIIGNTFSG
ncbi:hypothetical protein SAY86_000701 [Trapa natans]|uniref:RRM domain-containing protein n=1 Tax=Trapa natans TaxID=22666 RepID=A0AAN7M4F4_TRANT|nr:hypothetical protein SAY86_000701 [Trapa natans]